jgi:hypothetical protein
MGGLTYVGVPAAVAAVEGVDAGKTTAAVVAGAGLGGLIGSAIGAQLSAPPDPNADSASLQRAVLPTEIVALIGAVAGGLVGLNLWRRYERRTPLLPNPVSGGSKIVASSYERYNGGAKIKRQYGSSTVTRFYVYREEDKDDASKWLKVDGYGPTPGDRKTDAIRRSGLT